MFHDPKPPISAQAALAILFACQATSGRGEVMVNVTRHRTEDDETWAMLARERAFHARQRDLIRQAREDLARR